MKDNREKEPEIKVKSVKKALDVLNCFIKKQPAGRDGDQRDAGSV